MHYQQDWIMMQIEGIIKFIRGILTRSGGVNYFEDSRNLENKLLKSKIENLIGRKRFDEAELIIFEKIDNDKSFDIGTAFWFYENINSFSDPDLEKSNFSRERILEGIKSVCRKSEIIDTNTIELLMNTIE